MESLEWLVIFIVLFGCAYTSYGIGRKQGIKDYIEYCHQESKKYNGFILMHFFGHEINFLDPMEISKSIIDKVAEAAEKSGKA